MVIPDVEDLGVEIRGDMVGVYIESCKIVFLRGHFLFTCWDTFAAGCVI